ncbi:MAG: adenosylcobinamide-GDP ribazoletransferase [Anaerolineae bacterium]
MGFLEAVRLLTTIPIPRMKVPSEEEMARSLSYFPLVGTMLGSILVLVNNLLRPIWSTPMVNAILVVALIVLTGGMHLDGLADTSDGLFGGRSRGQKLAIMKDSHIGAFGTLAVLCTLLLKLSFLNELPDVLRGQSLILMPTLGRWAMVNAIFRYPSAREEGMGRTFREHCGVKELAIATMIATAFSFLLLGFWGLVLLVGVWLAATLINRALTRALGGLTGDTYGALCETSEVLVLGMIALLALVQK